MAQVQTIPSEYAIQTMETFFDYEEPQKSTMTLEDIAHALANVCRWGGHCHPFFSVAQHAVLVSDVAFADTRDPLIALYALHHDDHESVRGDIPTPRKRFLKKHGMLFKGEEEAEDKYIFKTLLGLEYPFPEAIAEPVRTADRKALFTERRYLKPWMKWHANDYKEVPPMSRANFAFYLSRKDWKKEYLRLHKELKGLIK